MIKDIITKLICLKDITRDEAIYFMNELMEGRCTPTQIGAFLTALRIKGESIEEITGCAMVMRSKAQRIEPNVSYSVDTCGTGGDALGTFNISTAAAFVAAAGGAFVAKHGNRSVSSSSGSADVLEALEINIDIPYSLTKTCIEQIGMGFMFAPTYHSAMKHAVGPRRELGVRTIFNILGPLTNPAGAKGQVLGVFDPLLTKPIAGVLNNLGIERALVVHGLDGLDEITLTAPTRVTELKDGVIKTYQIEPEQFGFERVGLEQLRGGDPAENAQIIISILNGEKGPMRDIVELNSGAALYVAKITASIDDGIILARTIIDEGLALKKLQELRNITQFVA